MNLQNELKYAANAPEVKNKFENVKTSFFGGSSSNSDIKDFQRNNPEYKTTRGVISKAAQDLARLLVFTRKDDGGVYLSTKETVKVNLYLTIPRGVRLKFNEINLTRQSEVEMTNIFNIYGSEGFSIKIANSEAEIVIEPAQESGVKGRSAVNVMSLENGIVIIDSADKYIDCSGILQDYRG